MHYYQFNIADYRKDTVHLSRLEHGIYRDLIDQYYLDEKPIPLETQSVKRRLRLVSEDETIALENVLLDFFNKSDDGWHHDRIDSDISEYQATCLKNKKNGKKGGRPRTKKPLQDKEENPVGYLSVDSGMPDQSKTNPNQEPITNNQEPVDISSEMSDAPPKSDQKKNIGTPAGSVCARLKAECRIIDVNPQHPKLIALLEAGLTDGEIVAAGIDSKIKTFAYVLAAAEGRRRDAANVTPLPAARSAKNAPAPENFDQRQYVGGAI